MSEVESKTIFQAFKHISHIKTFFVLKFCIFVCDLSCSQKSCSYEIRKLERSIYIFIKVNRKGLPLKGKVGKYTLFENANKNLIYFIYAS